MAPRTADLCSENNGSELNGPELNGPELNSPENNPAWREALHGADDALSTLMGAKGGRGAMGEDLRLGPVVELAQVWNGTVMEVRHAARGLLTLGALNADFAAPVDGLEGAPFPLLRCEDDGGFVATLRRSWRATHSRGGEHRDLDVCLRSGLANAVDAELVEVPLKSDDQLVIDIGEQLFIARVVPAGRKVVGARKAEGGILTSLAFSAFFGAALTLIALTQPPNADSEINSIPDRFAQILIETPPTPKVEAPKIKPKEDGGQKVKRKEGKRGDERSRMDQARGDMEQMREDRQIAEESGIFRQLDEDALSGMMGSGSLAADITGGIGGAIGAKGMPMGSGGLGSRGDGLGGGGAHNIGNNMGTKGGSGFAPVSTDVKREGKVSSPGVLVVGSLDRAQVDAVIKRNLSRFRYCYQRELTKNPVLGGKVVVKFIIANDGSVSAADIKASSLGNAEVESCLTNTMFKMQFPQPKGNGIVMVSYPFLFAPG